MIVLCVRVLTGVNTLECLGTYNEAGLCCVILRVVVHSKIIHMRRHPDTHLLR